VKPGFTKAKCLSTFASLKPFRSYSMQQTFGKFVKRNWVSFVAQAPQASYTLTGYGVVLGGVLGAMSDLTWAALRAWEGKGIKIVGPPERDPLVKAARYLMQPAVHMQGGAALSYEDHWLLLAADIIAIGIILEQTHPAVFLEREEELAQMHIPEIEPWEPSTIAALESMGWRSGDPQTVPLRGMSPNPTYFEMISTLAAGLPTWLEMIAADFPPTFSANWFSLAFSELGQQVFEWFEQTSGIIKPVFDREEIAFARMFETGVFPPDEHVPEQFVLMFEHLAEMLEAEARTAPSREMLKRAIRDSFGEVSEGNSL
jgi:hypothetical protein